ncbi:hypothetical protein CMV30_08125 [Nibricoccus aquaticus]|uniref:DUF2971 domain-containing protein n=1 Tax=Nibricoccus aquaticus TaxID=2576891 RepID=A0A290Q9P9_9BACT|nr:DUF2971 domain-containing protein [Nibricoccus aquaticus]ATC63920.1 hypothetical protein CMV30_08125 [Nibricoccus aquaticus]
MLPKSLFKHYSASLQSLENIKRQCFFFGGVDAFNDPFECQIAPASANDNDTVIQMMRDHYSSSPDIPDSIRQGIQKMDPLEFRDMLKRSAVDMVAQSKKDFIAHRGVTCFSERNENLLMWSHYSSGGTGVCLEFSTNSEIFEKAIKVHYKEKPPVLDALDILMSVFGTRKATWIDDMYCTKPADWHYEREWRVIHRSRGTVYIYPKESLKAVYFGPRCTREFVEIVCLTLLGQNRAVEFWKGAISHTKYAVEFERFTYTPNCEIVK